MVIVLRCQILNGSTLSYSRNKRRNLFGFCNSGQVARTLRPTLSRFVRKDGADEITVSAPRGRVDLEALKRPRLGGKEPSDDDYRV